MVKKEQLMKQLNLTKGLFWVMLDRINIIEQITESGMATIEEIQEWRVELLTELYEEYVLGDKLLKPFDKEEFDKMVGIINISREKLVGLVGNDKGIDMVLKSSTIPKLVLQNMAQSAVIDLYNDLDHVKEFNDLINN